MKAAKEAVETVGAPPADSAVGWLRRFEPLNVCASAAASLVLAFLVRKGWLDLDAAWDSLAYHLPFAALRGGILTPDQYHLSAWMRDLYQGFPGAADFIQGVLWRVTGRPQAANLIGLLGLLTLVASLRVLYRVPWGYSLLAFFCIPIVLIQSTSAYIDLFGNSLLTVMLLLVFSAISSPRTFSMARLVAVFALFAMVMNCKFTFLAVAPPALVVLGVVLWRNRAQLERLQAFWSKSSVLTRTAYVAVMLVLFSSAFVVEARNWRDFGNPVFPVGVKLGPVHLKGAVSGDGNEPVYLAHSPQSVKWLLSVFEYRAFEGRNPLWTNAQGDVAPPSSPAMRMGGYFAPLVLFNVLWMVIARKAAPTLGRAGIWFTGALAAWTSLLPASQELRYYFYWLLFLVALNLVQLVNGLGIAGSLPWRQLYLGTMASFLAFVLCATGFVYFRTATGSPDALVVNTGIHKKLADMQLRDGEPVCVIGRSPLTFLYAPIFNRDLADRSHYRVMEGYTPADCMGARVLP